MVLLVDKIRAVVKVATGAKDKATAEVLVAKNVKVAIKEKALVGDRYVVEA